MSHDIRYQKLEHLTNAKRSSKIVRDIQVEIKKILGYNYQIGKIPVNSFSKDEYWIKKKFGQVDTPKWISDLMVELTGIEPGQSVLEPCFGNGVFLISLHEKFQTLSTQKQAKITGIEIDPISFAKGIINYSKSGGNIANCSFLNGSIFDLEKTKYDIVIMNPPYVRQEELSEHNLNKGFLVKKTQDITNDAHISARSNLYSYFIIYLTKFLQSSGTMCVIIPKAWLDSKHGESLQGFLLNNYTIQCIIDFDKDTFSSVIVEDCILVLKKNHIPKQEKKTGFVHLKKKESIEKIVDSINSARDFEDDAIKILHISNKIMASDSKWGKFLHVPSKVITLLTNKKMTPLTELTFITRGTTTLWNEFFMIGTSTIKEFDIDDSFYIPVIKSPRDLGGFDTSIGASTSHMLFIHDPLEKTESTKGIRKYVQQTICEKKEMLPVTVNRLIAKNQNSWYTAVKPKSGPIIFSYIIRNTKNFVLNKKSYTIRDNFYILLPKSNLDAILLFGILNSSIIKLSLEMIGRRYGNGLLKIQAYELKNMCVPDVRQMGKSTRDKIRYLAKQLSCCSYGDPKVELLIAKIDKLVYAFLDLKLTQNEIKEAEKNMMGNRLQRTHGTHLD